MSDKNQEWKDYAPWAIPVVVFVFVMGGLMHDVEQNRIKRCAAAILAIADYKKCEAMEGCTFQLVDINENTKQILRHEACLAKELEE